MADLDTIPITDEDDQQQLLLTQAIAQYKTEAEDATKTRRDRNSHNRDAYLGLQDFSDKPEGMSRETLPKLSLAVEHLGALVLNSLTTFGDWFEIEVPADSPISGLQIKRWLDCYLNGNILVAKNRKCNMATIVANAVKTVSIEADITFKVHGQIVDGPVYSDESGAGLSVSSRKRWHPRIDLVRIDDHHVDPTGSGLFEIHTTEKDLFEVLDMAEDGVYSQGAVDKLKGTSHERDKSEKIDEAHLGQDFSTPPSFRKKVVIDEFWGTLLGPDGSVAQRNILATIANEKIVLRKPRLNPFWHQESPFVRLSIYHLLGSTVNKALFDEAAQLNTAMNEVFNLILDGGLASVWGIKQLREDALADPEEVSNGIPQGATIKVTNMLPFGEKALEDVATGKVPGEALHVFEALAQEFMQAAVMNELRLGSLPSKQVRATEILEVDQAQDVLLQSFMHNVEMALVRVLRLLWLTILQNMENIPPEEVQEAIGPDAAFELMRMSRRERFELFANKCGFKVFGLSHAVQRARSFQKLAALLQIVMAHPMLLQSFFTKYSPDRIVAFMLRALNIDPVDFHRDAKELQQIDQEFMKALQVAEAFGSGAPQRGAGLSAERSGEPQTPSQVSQLSNPLTGITPNAGQ